MQTIQFGRKIFSFGKGEPVLESTSITEKALSHEDECAFTRRILQKYDSEQGTIEIVFKRGRPDYAIITFE
jgi:hypothetical protein